MEKLSLRRDERGNSVVELALVLPIFATLVVGMVDIARGYSTKLLTQQAAQRAIEKVMQTTANSTVVDSLKSEAAAGAGVTVNDVAVDYWLECDGTRAASYDSVCTSGQTYARYLTVDVTKVHTPMFGMRFAGASANGTYTLHGKAGIRTQ